MSRRIGRAVGLLLMSLIGLSTAFGQEPPAPLSAMAVKAATPMSTAGDLERDLEKRVRKSPRDGAAWRLLGHARMERGDWEGAMDALEHAVTLQQLSAAAFFDYGRAASHLGRPDAAKVALERVQAIAPQSEYATQAKEMLEQLASEEGGVQLASFDLRTFDGSNLTPLISPDFTKDEPTWYDGVDARIDLGAQYNSNVTLAPSSRELSGSQKHSAQGMASAALRWAIIKNDVLRFGPSLDLDFTLNEFNLDQYNLQSYRPGLFAETTWDAGTVTLKPRVAYAYDHDEFGGNTFGDKHSVAFSTAALWTPGQTTTWYYSIDNNNIANDGVDPTVTSQDGWSNTIGAVHDFVNKDWFIRSFRLGADFQNVNTEGSTYRYRAVSTYAQSVLVLAPTWHLRMRGGYAYRDYPDFTESPSRNTNVFRTGTELRKYFDDGLSAAIYSNFDKFASRNERFDSQRYITGAQLSWEY